MHRCWNSEEFAFYIGLKWLINSISQSFNSLIKWKLIPLLDRCLLFEKVDFSLVYKDIDLLQTKGSLKVISRHASDFHTGLGFPENEKRDPSL